jgi:glycosyltransferase involved in cell wall biosynthesis
MISIIVPVYNDEKYVQQAIESILIQSYKNFELILYDDCSTDNSLKVMRSFKDKRIRIFANKNNMGIAKIRNRAIRESKGEYLFFTDSDCIVDKDWLKNGLRGFKDKNCLGVEGKTFYVSKSFKKSISDKTPGDVDGEGQFLGCNIAFRKNIMLKLNGYDERYSYHDDKEFALRVQERGKIVRQMDMIVFHQRKLWTVKSYIKSGKRAMDRILLYKYHNDKSFVTFHILFIKNLLKILFPPLLIYTIINNRPKTSLDYKIVLASYVRCVYERYCIWKAAIKERVFLI